MKVNTALSASIGVVCGSSGSGKSVTIKKAIHKVPRLLVWDIDDEYSGPEGVPGVQRITSIAELARKVAGAKKGRFAFVGKVDQFEAWCRIAFAWGNCFCVAEELAGVTSPGKAPPAWHTLVSRGRKRGIALIGVTQRPAESDKTIMGNASFIRVGRLSRAQDRRYMASEIDVPERYINELENLQYIQKNMAKNQYLAGKIAVPDSGTPSLTKVRINEKPLTVTA